MRINPLRMATGVGLTLLPLAVAAAVIFPVSALHAAPAVLLVGLVAGVPHGAFDHRVSSWAGATPLDSSTPGGVFARYLLWAPAVLAALLLFSGPTLTCLLAVSIAHFAEGEAAFAPRRDGRSRDLLDGAAGWVIGVAMVLVPLLAHPAPSVHLVRLATGWSPALPPAPVRNALVVGIVAGGTLVAAVVLRAGRRVQAAEVTLVVLLGVVAPPGVAFGVSFAVVHSAHHLGRLADLRSHRPRPQRAGIGASLTGSLTGSLLPLAITASIGATCWAATGAPLIRIVLGAMLALTVPHAAIVSTTMDGRRWPPSRWGRHRGRLLPWAATGSPRTAHLHRQ